MLYPWVCDINREQKDKDDMCNFVLLGISTSGTKKIKLRCMSSMANSFTFENYVLFAFLLFAHDDNRSLYAYKGLKTGELLWCWRLN